MLKLNPQNLSWVVRWMSDYIIILEHYETGYVLTFKSNGWKTAFLLKIVKLFSVAEVRKVEHLCCFHTHLLPALWVVEISPEAPDGGVWVVNYDVDVDIAMKCTVFLWFCRCTLWRSWRSSYQNLTNSLTSTRRLLSIPSSKFFTFLDWPPNSSWTLTATSTAPTCLRIWPNSCQRFALWLLWTSTSAYKLWGFLNIFEQPMTIIFGMQDSSIGFIIVQHF